MTDLVTADISMERLPALIDRARNRLAEARTSAEVLEAKHVAEAALHYAKVTGAANEAHVDCLRIITRCEIRLAREIDAAQERGEVAKQGQRADVRSADISGLDDLGIDRRRVAEWRDMAEAGEDAVDEAIDKAAATARKFGGSVGKAAVRRNLGRGLDDIRPDPSVQMAGDILDFLCRIPLGKYSPEEAAEVTDPKMVEAIDRYFDEALEWFEGWSSAWRQRRNAKRSGGAAPSAGHGNQWKL
jgi:hypothetical protein